MAETDRTIAIVGGTGPLGSGLALRWTRAGERIMIGSRDAARAAAAAAKIEKQAGATPGSVQGAENREAVAAASVIVLAVPFEGHASLLKQLQPAFRPGSILIDTTVPLAASVGGRATRTLGVWQGSAAEQAAELVPESVAVAAAFQNLSAGLLQGSAPLDCDVIICTDDARARLASMELARKLPGVRALDGGGLDRARILEQITALLIGFNLKYRVHGAGLRITGLPKER